jgi:hypothetical protein
MLLCKVDSWRRTVHSKQNFPLGEANLQRVNDPYIGLYYVNCTVEVVNSKHIRGPVLWLSCARSGHV